MKLSPLNQIAFGLSTFCFIASTEAGLPLWTFMPDAHFPPKTFVSTSGTATVKYAVTNNTSKIRNLVIKPKKGISQASPCVIGPKGSVNSTCILTLTVEGSLLPSNGLSAGPILCQADPNGTPNPNQCYQPSKESSLWITPVESVPILSASTQNLALSVKCSSVYPGCTANNPALTGHPRKIKITNTGDTPATGVSVNYPSWPTGTIASSNCDGITLEANGGSCTVTVTPGAVATSGLGGQACINGIEPNPGVVSLTASNASQISINVVVLGYGCQYQGGFLYSVDDTTSNMSSIAGKVISLLDQAPAFPNGIIWSSNGGTGHGSGGSDSIDASFDTIPGIDESSTFLMGSPTYTQPAGPSGYTFTDFFIATYTNANPFNSSSFGVCNGKSDGQCNTSGILTFYNEFITNFNASENPLFTASQGPTPLPYYAAGLCANYTIDSLGNSPCSTETCYTNWYLPAICEMGPDSNGNHICSTTNVEQNIVDNLSFLLSNTSPCTGPTGCLSGSYWSSTEFAGFPQFDAWYENFASSASFQSPHYKYIQLGVRCSRALTF